ncbi:hypothetical protein EB796_000503 [Bugula neritina]|uniref:Serine aminopeptidase S33 domain-containing protein n=1 Tax=Bugula neritina TaxID=10212 RepID=A0A7J7KSU2_BUGNE|nr:hypothetical protein EB796_000503 [Bugula neritina]
MAAQLSSIEDIQTFTNTREQKLRRWCLADVNISPNYEDVAKSLQKNHNIAVHGYDQVGHGRSEGARAIIHDFQHYVDDAIQFVDIIKSEYPDVPVFVMGHSMGGLVLGHLLIRESELCDGAIMYAAAVHVNTDIVSAFKRSISRCTGIVLPFFPVKRVDDNLLTRNAEEVKRLKNDPLRYQGSIKARWVSNCIKAAMEFNEQMSEITVPMFIAHGDDDKVCHIEGSTKLEKTVSSKDKIFMVYGGCYHRLHTEPDGYGERFIDDVGNGSLAIVETVFNNSSASLC